MKEYAEDMESLIKRMMETEQTPGQNMLQHGNAVRQAYLSLIEDLESGEHVASRLYGSLKPELLDDDLIERYQVYHDCGKPVCEEEGRFPNHAWHSQQQWLTIAPRDSIVVELMGLDMEFHLRRGEGIEELWKSPLAPTLYLTAWAEIEANAKMFGGRDSESYKIKRKRLIQAGKKCPLGTW